MAAAAPMSATADADMQNIQTAAAPLAALLPPRAWIAWRAVPKANGKIDKPPLFGATSDNPNTWQTLPAAIEYLKRDHVAGIAFVITPGVIALDYDNCRDPVTGQLTDEAQAELERFNSYAYVTPSYRGFRIVGRNNAVTPIPGGKRKMMLPGGTSVEIFIGPTNHYNTFTHATIDGYHTVRDISAEVLDYLQSLPSVREHEPTSAEPQRGMEAISKALRTIPNTTQDWDHWNRVGMAVWRSSAGSPDGLAAWEEWSAKHECHEPAACVDRWQHYFRSPPTRVGFGTLYHMARQANPLFVAPFEAWDGMNSEPEPDKAPEPDAAQKPKTKRILSLADLKNLPEPAWLVEDLIPEAGFVVPFGPPKAGKTFVILSMGLHIAAHKPWFGRAVSGGGVVYLAGEGVTGMALRIPAMQNLYQIGDNVPFWVIPRMTNFQDPEAVRELVKIIRDEVLDEPIALIIIDTLARAMPGADENSAQEVGRVIAQCDWLKEQFGCAVMPIHHEGKDGGRGLRGTSAIRGAVDTALRITGSKRETKLEVVDQKEGESGLILNFEMQEVSVSLKRTSLVPVLKEQPDMSASEPDKNETVRLNDTDKVVLEALRHALSGPEAGHAGTLAGHLGLSGSVMVISVDDWRATFRAMSPDKNLVATQKAFVRSATKLTRWNIAKIMEKWAWMV